MRCSPLALLLWLILATTSIAFAGRPPQVVGNCEEPDHQSRISCRIAGHHFRPREHVRLIYHFTGVGPDGHPRTLNYHRATTTNGHGDFLPPPLLFKVDRTRTGFQLTVRATGKGGDSATFAMFGA